MKYSRSDIHRKTHKIPTIRFEDQALTSFSGSVVLQRLFANLNLKERLRTCFSHLPVSPIFGHHLIVLLLVVHLLLGYRELRDIRYYHDDPLVKRLLGLRRLPDVATVSRTLASAGKRSVEKLREFCRQLVLERLRLLGPRRLTLNRARMKKVLAFHNGRGAQEGIFAELKSHCQMDYVPVRTRVGNQIFLLSAVLAHNLTRELQMAAQPPQRATTEKRTPLWIFQRLGTLRRNLIQRAGRLTRPQGALTLTMSGNMAVKHELIALPARASARSLTTQAADFLATLGVTLRTPQPLACRRTLGLARRHKGLFHHAAPDR